MKTVSISLPESLFGYARVRAKEQGNMSDYVRSLIREEQKRKEKNRVEKLLLEGLASGFVPIKNWEHFKENMLRRLK